MESDADAVAKHFQAAMMEVVNQHVRSVEEAIRSEADQRAKFDADRISALRAQLSAAVPTDQLAVRGKRALDEAEPSNASFGAASFRVAFVWCG